MGLFIAKGAGLQPDNATIDLIAIANMDTGYGENNISADRNQVTYARTLGGVCQLRLDDLVNEITYASPPDIVIFAVDGSFMLADGTLITSVGGIAIPVGDALNPTASDVATIYDTSDCNGNHYWVDADGGGTTTLPSSVIIYHELAHCFHFVTGVATTEVLAETDENDMRDQLGISHRDVNSHNGGCGGTGYSCCIIASISTGSPYSNEVNHLRAVRDKILRRSEVGDDFFNQLHYDYYEFSPEICSVMGNNPELSDLVKTFFVTPLIFTLELFSYYTDTKGKNLTAFLKKQFEDEQFKHQYNLQLLRQLNFFLNLTDQSSIPDIPPEMLPEWIKKIKGIGSLFNHLRASAFGSPLIKWALLDSLHIWVQGALEMLSGKSDDSSEKFLYKSISGWISGFPVTNVWNDFSRIQTNIELQNLGNYIFDADGKLNFAQRLISNHGEHKETILQWSLN